MFKNLLLFFEENNNKYLSHLIIILLLIFFNSYLCKKIITNIGGTKKYQIYIEKILNLKFFYFFYKFFILFKGFSNIFINTNLKIILYILNIKFFSFLINRIRLIRLGRTNIIHKINSNYNLLLDNSLILNLFLLTSIINNKELKKNNLELINLISYLIHFSPSHIDIEVFHKLLFNNISIGDYQFLNKYHFLGNKILRIIENKNILNKATLDSLFSLLFYINPEVFFKGHLNKKAISKFFLLSNHRLKDRFLINNLIKRYDYTFLNPKTSSKVFRKLSSVSISIIGQVRYPIQEKKFLSSNIKPILKLINKNIFIYNYNWLDIGFKVPFNHHEFCEDHLENFDDEEKKIIRENKKNHNFDYFHLIHNSINKKINLKSYNETLNTSLNELLLFEKNKLTFSQYNNSLNEKKLSLKSHFPNIQFNRSEVNQSKFLFVFLNAVINNPDCDLNFIMRPDLVLKLNENVNVLKYLPKTKKPLVSTDYDPQATLQSYPGTGDRIFIFNKMGIISLKNFLLNFSNIEEFEGNKNKAIFKIWIKLVILLKNQNLLCGHSWPQFLFDSAGIIIRPMFNLEILLPRVQVSRQLLKNFLTKTV